MAAIAGKVDSFENSLLLLIFNATAIALLARDAAVPAANLYVALHKADPTEEAANQAAQECDYTGYSGTGRRPAARTSGGWTVSGNSVVNAAALTFGQNTGASQTITHFSVGGEASGATAIYYAGLITTPSGGLVCSPYVTPSFAAATGITITEN